MIVDRDTPAHEVLRVLRSAGGELLESTRIFDVYQGAQLPEGKKSIAVGMSFRAPGATLTQADVGEVITRMIAALQNELDGGVREVTLFLPSTDNERQ